MRARNVVLALTVTVVAIPAVMISVDAVVRWHPAPDSGTAARVAAAPDLDGYLAAREDSVAGVKPALRKGIVWHDSAHKPRTPLSIIYLHGFSASRAELSPVVERLADSLGANLFFTRFAAHGRVDGEAFARVKPQQWIDDAREALAIGRRIGDKVVVIGTSTGALPALQVVSESAEDSNAFAPVALILVSPNHEPADWRARFVAGPFGPALAQLISGRHREFAPVNPAHAELWTPRYRIEGVSALMDLVLHAQTIDLSRIRVPLLTLYTRHDDVVNIALVRTRHDAFGSPVKEIVDVPEGTRHDDVVNIDLVRTRHDAFGSPVKEIVDVPEATRHELASAALAPQAVDPVVARMLRFVRANVAAREAAPRR